jgi:hypothetical protein
LRALRLLADTGNPFELIVSSAVLDTFAFKEAPNADTNFGTLVGGWVWVVIPQLKFAEKCPGFANDAVYQAAKSSSRKFDGLAGLPLLRRFEFGGDADWFWLKGS